VEKQGASPPAVTVAYLLPRLEMGGTEKHVRDLIGRLDRRRFRPIVIATSEGGVLESEFARMGVTVQVLSYRGFTRRPGKIVGTARSSAAAIRGLARILRREQVSILHAYLPAANVIGTLAALLARTPRIIVSKRGLCHYKKERPILAFFENVANLAADAVLVNSNAVGAAVRSAERFCDRKIRRIYNGIDTALPEGSGAAAIPPCSPALVPPLPPDAGVILYVANLFPYKGHLDLVGAAATVTARFPKARFVLAGREEGTGAQVRNRIEALGLGDQVRLLGPREDIPALMAAASLVAHPSHEEGFSNTILEAMAAGKAVVATAVGGIPEAVEDGVTGILVPPRRPERMAEALLSLLEDPAGARAMGEAGRRRVLEQFPLGKMVREIEALYDDLLPGRNRPCAE
jgi:glycosyltransferase involved in cell wall biosynthesis